MNSKISNILTHLLFFGGMAIGVYGVWMIFRPAGFLVAAGLMVWISLLIDKEYSR